MVQIKPRLCATTVFHPGKRQSWKIIELSTYKSFSLLLFLLLKYWTFCQTSIAYLNVFLDGFIYIQVHLHVAANLSININTSNTSIWLGCWTRLSTIVKLEVTRHYGIHCYQYNKCPQTHLDTVGVRVDAAVPPAAPLVDVVHGVRHRLQVKCAACGPGVKVNVGNVW